MESPFHTSANYLGHRDTPLRASLLPVPSLSRELSRSIRIEPKLPIYSHYAHLRRDGFLKVAIPEVIARTRTTSATPSKLERI